MEECIIYNFTI